MISDDAVRKATGRVWDDWFEFLDSRGATDLSHKEIVRLTGEQGGVGSIWWRQEITGAYEKARGLRVIGQTADAGFQVGVTKTFPISTDRAWKLITGMDGLGIWLGDIDELTLVKGESYHTGDGTSGEIRSVSPGIRLRLTWKPPHLMNPATLQFTLVPSGDRTSVRVHLEKLPDAGERDRMKTHWKEVLGKLLNLLG